MNLFTRTDSDEEDRQYLAYSLPLGVRNRIILDVHPSWIMIELYRGRLPQSPEGWMQTIAERRVKITVLER